MENKLQDLGKDHKLNMVMLAIFVGFFSCLVRTDYNLIIVLFVYFVWQNRKDILALKIIIGSVIVLFAADLLFLMTEIPVWMSTDSNNQVWQTIRPLHNFGVFCFILINILKVIMLILGVQSHSLMNNSIQN